MELKGRKGRKGGVKEKKESKILECMRESP